MAAPFLLLLFSLLSVSAQTRLEGIDTPCAPLDLKQGLVVESVAKNSEGEKAGLAEGDILLDWSRGDARGQIESPFNLSEIETGQEPRGRVTLDGTRNGVHQTWVIGPDKWGIHARPSLSSPLLAIYREGQALAKAGKLAEAAEQWRAAAGQKHACSWLSAWFLFHGAEAFANARQWNYSKDLYQEALGRAASSMPEVRAQLLQAIAEVFQQQSDLANAEKDLQEALKEIQRSGSNRLAAAVSLNSLAVIADELGKLAKAQEYFQQALAINERQAPGSLAMATSLHGLGSIADERGDFDKAEAYNLQALEIRMRLAPDGLGVAASLNNLGNVSQDHGELDKAEEYYAQALEIRTRLAPGTRDVVQSLNGLGNIADDRGELDKAKDYYQEALEIGTTLAPDSLGVAASLNNLGLIANERGDLSRTEDYYHHALEIRRRLAPGSLDVAASLNNLGNVEDDRGNIAKAEDYYRQALEIEKQRAPRSLAVPTGLYNLGEDAHRRRDLARADGYFHQALAIFQKAAPDSLQVAMCLAGLGGVARDRRDLAGAEKYDLQALTITEKLAPGSLDVATGFNALGDIARDRGDPEKGEQYYRQALEIRKKLAPESAACAESLAALAGIMRERQQWEESARLFSRAIDVLESQIVLMGGSSDIRAGFRAKHADYYSAYSDLLLTQKLPDLAFQVLERSRARTLMEMLTEAHVDIRQGADVSLLEQEKVLRISLTAKSNRKIDLLQGERTEAQVAAFTKEINALLNQYEEVEGQIRTSSPNYAALTQPRPLSAKEVQEQLLDADTVLLEYSLGEKRSFVFMVTPTSLDSYELPKRSEIENAARRAYNLLTSRNRWVEGETSSQRRLRLAGGELEYRKASAALSGMILGPIALRLQAKRLLIVADGALQYIPFAVLPVPASDPAKPPAPLVSQHEIVNLPSASVLALLRRQASGREPASKEAAVLADPVFDKDDPRVSRAPRHKHTIEPASINETMPPFSRRFPEPLTRSLGDVGLGTPRAGSALPRLAFSRREADAIMSITDPGRGMEALDFEASREKALSKDLGQYRIVHFATHGLLDNEHPELSGLVFSLVDREGKSRDGFLALEDVYNLTLPVDLVVLSACETALGKQIAGEGLVGLTRGFMYAGATRVVASLWKVDDMATADLMARFYRGMLKESLRPAAALRQAQIEMRAQKRWSDPYYWGAFTLQGEWK